MGGRECDAASAEADKTSGGAISASTTSVADTGTSGISSASGSGGSRRSRSGSGKTAGRRSVPTTPPATSPPGLKVEAEELLRDRTKLAERLKQDLMEHYLLESAAGKDENINPQHSRASRKQAKELAELIWRLNAETDK